MTTITLPPLQTLRTLPPKKQQELVTYLVKYTTDWYGLDSVDLSKMLDSMHRETKQKGLTETKLKKLLAKK